MREAVREKVAIHLEAALGKSIEITHLTDDTELNTLGLDSLLTISAIVGLSEDCGIDLSEHADTLSVPHTIGDLLGIATFFMEKTHAN